MRGGSSLDAILTLLSKREVSLDPRISVWVVLQRIKYIILGLSRGLLFAHRRIVLGRGAKISDLSKLQIGGGIVRIEDYACIDCTSTEGVVVGKNFKLGSYSRIIASGTLRELGKGVYIGDNVGIGEFSYIGGGGGVNIGSDCIIGQYFSAHPENHVFSDTGLPIREQGVTRKGIIVGADCWIGAKVTLLDGVEIGEGCVIAAGSVVTKKFPSNSVIGGVPAQLLHYRSAKR